MHREFRLWIPSLSIRRRWPLSWRPACNSFCSPESTPIFTKVTSSRKSMFPTSSADSDRLVSELQGARSTSAGIEEAQALNYLKATKFRVALLLNFGSPGMSWNGSGLVLVISHSFVIRAYPSCISSWIRSKCSSRLLRGHRSAGNAGLGTCRSGACGRCPGSAAALPAGRGHALGPSRCCSNSRPSHPG